ncbi:MAG: type II toxin-antitoxin system VapC family toxin [Acidimicrobiia bacterium]
MVDAGPLIASVDAGDRNHRACRALLEGHPGPLFVPMLVIPEVVHFIDRDLDTAAELDFLADVSDGTFEAIPVETEDWARIIELTWTYRDMSLGTVDASVIALAERLRIGTIATLDHKHFSVVRPAHVESFELLP